MNGFHLQNPRITRVMHWRDATSSEMYFVIVVVVVIVVGKQTHFTNVGKIVALANEDERWRRKIFCENPKP